MDPGWEEARTGAWKLLTPGGARTISHRKSVLIATRTYAAGAALQFLGLGAFLALLSHDLRATQGMLAVAALGSFDLFLIALFRSRKLPLEDPKALSAVFAQTFMIGFAFAEAAVLFGFIGLFIARRGQLLIYLTGAAFGLAGVGMIAPTRGRLARLQKRLEARGSSLSILEVLNQPPLPPYQRPGGRGGKR